MRIGDLVLLFAALDCASAADTRYFIEPMTAEPYIDHLHQA